MYVTRYLSQYKQSPDSLSLSPPEGPNSGYLVIQDEQSVGTCCFGWCRDDNIQEMPFPQDKILKVQYSYTVQAGDDRVRRTENDYLYFIPVLNQPLSSNRYYAIKARGRHAGEAYLCSSEEDKVPCCFFKCVTDLKPRELDYRNAYQQVEISVYESCFGPSGYFGKSIAQDGYPPKFLARKGWKVYTSTPIRFPLGEAQGIDVSLRARLPDFDYFPLSSKSSGSVVVGKWYTPFMFIKGGGGVKDQMEKTMFYEITLEQQWKKIYECDNNLNNQNFVAVDVSVQTEVAFLFGNEALHDLTQVNEGVIWFSTANGGGAGGESRVGLSSAVVERMRWEQERVGWRGGKDEQVRVEKVDEFQGGYGMWKKYGCYILVERFVFKRMDGSLLLTCEFRHGQHIRSKWE